MSDDARPNKPRPKRYLLTAVALSTGSLMAGCGSHQAADDPGGQGADTVTQDPLPLPANPKGAVYDDGVHPDPVPDPDGVEGDPEGEADPEAESGDEGGPRLPEPEPTPVEQPRPRPLPANPKGALYDHGAYDDDGERRG